jgi:hypothetical protein
MALVEAGAFAYCLRSWRGMTGRSANVMALMIGGSAVTFVIVLSPYIAANVSKIGMSALLTGGCQWAGRACIVYDPDHASIGYAEAPPGRDRAQVLLKVARHSRRWRTLTRHAKSMTQWRDNGHQVSRHWRLS